MKVIVVVSEKDEAGMCISKFLENVKSIDEEPIYYNEKIEADLIIFATKHASKQGHPAFCCHTSGNWGNNELGGDKNSFSIAPAFLLRETLIRLQKYEREIFQEVTHHGPTIEIPSLFIEIGSTKEEWIKEENGKIIADVIKELIEILKPFKTYKDFEEYYRKKNNIQVAIAVGGLHHTPNFKKHIINGEIAIGHGCAKYNLEDFSEETLEKAIKATAEKIDLIVVDWKGLGQYKQKVSEILNKKNLKWKKSKEIISSLP